MQITIPNKKCINHSKSTYRLIMMPLHTVIHFMDLLATIISKHEKGVYINCNFLLFIFSHSFSYKTASKDGYKFAGKIVDPDTEGLNASAVLEQNDFLNNSINE